MPVLGYGPDGMILSAFTDADGSFSLEDLGTGRYLITLAIAGVASSAVVDVDPASGSSYTAALQAPAATAQLAGVVKSSDGSLLAGVKVRLLQDGLVVTGTLTNRDGRYCFDLVSSGMFDLQAAVDGASFTPITGVTVTAGSTIERQITAGQRYAQRDS